LLKKDFTPKELFIFKISGKTPTRANYPPTEVNAPKRFIPSFNHSFFLHAKVKIFQHHQTLASRGRSKGANREGWD